MKTRDLNCLNPRIFEIDFKREQSLISFRDEEEKREKMVEFKLAIQLFGQSLA